MYERYARRVAKYVLQETQNLIHTNDIAAYHKKVAQHMDFLEHYHSAMVDRIKMDIIVLLYKIKHK